MHIGGIKYILVTSLVLLSSLVYAQECEWLEVGGSLGADDAWKVTTDQNDDVITAGYFSDNFSIGAHSFTRLGFTGDFFLIKHAPDGTIKWAKTTRTTGWKSRLHKIDADKNNNIYLCGTFNVSIDFGNNVTLTANSTLLNHFLVKYDSTGTAQWAVKIERSAQFGYLTSTIDDVNNVYITFNTDSIANFSGTNQTISNINGSEDIVIVKYSSTGQFLKATSFGGQNTGTRPYAIGADGANNLYLVGAGGTINFAGKQLPGLGETIFKLDSSLTPIKALKYAGAISVFTDIAMQENGNFVVINNFESSIRINNDTLLKSPWKTGYGYNSIGILYFDSSLTPIWTRTNRSVASSTPSTAVPAVIPWGGVSIKNDNIYISGSYERAPTRLGSNNLSYPGSRYKLFTAKIDSLGNFLWAFANNDTSGNTVIFDSEPDKKGNVYLVGNYTDKIALFNKSANGVNSSLSSDFFIAKISDYAIYRGPVSSGPYCAGDTFKVPYTKQGTYNLGNEFIAELSDSAGNFDGNHRELGRVKDTASGVVNGKLPLFNVATTNKYRIRIISTNPVVQSYYKFDKLRLLIYSKDTANAGADRYICKGQPVRLGTTGGSKWEWSPTNYFTNPTEYTNRQPEIKLYDSAEFRIIISDSSGCGEIDTDFVKIYVHPYIETEIIGDSIVCEGATHNLQAKVTGGKSNQYWYLWKSVGSGSILSSSSTVIIASSDTTTYYVVVGDSCSDKLDTAFFTVYVQNNLKAHPSVDTTVCKGKAAILSVKGTGCNPDNYTYVWTEKGSSTILNTNDSVTVRPQTTTQYQVILRDVGTSLIDTATITVTVDNVFNISAIKDSTICLGQTIDLSADVFSCDTSNIRYYWDNGLGAGKTQTVSPTKTTTYTVRVRNAFNGLNSTTQVTITVRDPLQLSINSDSTICIGEEAELRVISSGGKTNSHFIQWFANNQPLPNNTNTLKVTPTTSTPYKAILSDGCSINDSAEITITVRPKLELTVNADSTICIGEEAELRATVTGGYTPQHQIQWTTNNQPLSTNSILKVNPITTAIYKAALSDDCTIPNDSATITITVRKPLNVSVNQDSTICIGEEAELRALPIGGYTPQYQIQWATNNQPLSTSNRLKVNPITTTTYKVKVSDNCTTIPDSVTITITVRDPLQLTTTAKDSICSNEILLLTATPTGGYMPNYNIQWATDNSLWTSNQNPATDTPKIATRYIATLTDNCSPTVYDTLQVTVLPIPKANFTAIPTNGCPPLIVNLTENSTDNDSTQNTWTIGKGEYQGTKTQQHELLKTGVYTIKLNVKNVLGCSDEKTLPNAINVFAKPKASFIIKPDIKEVEESLQLYNLSQNYANVVWDMGDGSVLNSSYGKDTSYKYHEYDTGKRVVQLIATNNKGCKDTSKQQILLFDKINCLIPSAFTPNKDNLNNTFAPVCVGAANYTLTIYNRWGQVIFQQDNGAWDGNYAGQTAPTGMYLYKIQIQANSHKKKLTYGTVQLIR